MNISLLKSFDNIMFEQTKIDYKTYFFIGFLLIIFNTINNSIFQGTTSTIYLILIALPLLFSLFPIAINFLIYIINTSTVKSNSKRYKHNIFYYLDIFSLNKNEFEDILNKEYNIKNLTKSDEYLIDQILINAIILKAKTNWHNLSMLLTILIFIEIYVRWVFSIGLLNNL